LELLIPPIATVGILIFFSAQCNIAKLALKADFFVEDLKNDPKAI